jgi:hypothetical protein
VIKLTLPQKISIKKIIAARGKNFALGYFQDGLPLNPKERST